MAVKGFILGINNVIVQKGALDAHWFTEVGRLLHFLLSKGIKPVVLSNHDWSVKDTSGSTIRLQDYVTSKIGAFPWHVHNRDGTPPKPRREATQHVLNAHGWQSEEVVYLGNTEDDMRTAVNGDLLFLNATWYGRNSVYGFEFSSPKEVARFVDLFCLRDHLWHFTIVDGALEYYALAPYSTKLAEFAAYSTDARSAAKFGTGHPEFWTKYLWSTIYLSGLHKSVNYVAPYPGHSAGSGNAVMDDAMQAFCKCFRKTYLRDLIIRHKTATKLAYARAGGDKVDATTQLNTIVLNAHPARSATKTYAHPPLRGDKSLLVVDDICTRGYSLETARAFAGQTGSRVVLLSWLKTISTPYEQFTKVPNFDPYATQTFAHPFPIQTRHYSDHVVEPDAPAQLSARLKTFDTWNWP